MKTEAEPEASINTVSKRDVLFIQEKKYDKPSLFYTWEWNIFIASNSYLASRDSSAASKHKHTGLLSLGQAGLTRT